MTEAAWTWRQPVVLGMVLLLAACTAPIDNTQLIKQYQDRKNAGDLEATLAMFTPDAELHFGPLGSLQGHDAVRAIHEYDVALETIVLFDNCTASGNQVSCTVVETNEWLRLAGIAELSYDESVFSISDDGRIESVSAVLSPESGQAMGAALTTFDGWARMNRAEDYAALFSEGGDFVYSYDNGLRVLELLREWRRSTEAQ